MKKNLQIAMLLAFALVGVISSAKGQIASPFPKTYQMLVSGSTGLDTLTDTETINATKAVDIKATRIKIQVNCDRVNSSGSGTVLAILQSSLDNVNWHNHFGTSADSIQFTDTDSPQSGIYDVGTPNATPYFRVTGIGTGTANTEIQSIIRYVN